MAASKVPRFLALAAKSAGTCVRNVCEGQSPNSTADVESGLVMSGDIHSGRSCAQGSLVASKGSIVFRELLIFTTNRGICFRSISKFIGWNRWDSDTVLAQQKSSGVINPFAIDNFSKVSILQTASKNSLLGRSTRSGALSIWVAPKRLKGRQASATASGSPRLEGGFIGCSEESLWLSTSSIVEPHSGVAVHHLANCR
jgi:hypothetical protein